MLEEAMTLQDTFAKLFSLNFIPGLASTILL